MRTELTNEFFIHALYNLFLGRNADRAGLDTYSYQSPQYVALSLINSHERTQKILENPIFFPMQPEANLHDILSFFQDNKNDLIPNLIRAEYCISKKRADVAVNYFTDIDKIDSLHCVVRILFFLNIFDFTKFERIYSRALLKFGYDDIQKIHSFLLPDKIYENKIEEKNLKWTEMLSSPCIISDAIMSLIIKNIDIYSVNKIKELFQSSLVVRGLNNHSIKKCMNVIDEIFSKSSNIDCGSNQIEINRLIYISGTSSSGSSAIYDFLRQHNYFADPFQSNLFNHHGDREIPFIQNNGIEYLFDSLEDRLLLQKRLLLFFIYHILSFFIPTYYDMLNIRYRFSISSALTSSDKFFFNILSIVKIFFCKLKQIKKHQLVQYSIIFHNFVINISKAIDKKTDGKDILLNNAIVIGGNWYEKIYLVSLNSTFIFVYRDVRDQFISWNISWNGYTVEKYCSVILERYIKLYEFCCKNKGKIQIIPISYERFVYDDSYRQQLLIKLGCQGGVMSKYFDPEFSKTRIGKYKSYQNQEEIQYIETLLPNFVSGEFFKRFEVD